MFYCCCFNYFCLFQQRHSKNACAKSLRMPRQYEDVHWNPDSDCYMLQVTTLNYILTPVVMGMTLALVSNFCMAFNIFNYVQLFYFFIYLHDTSDIIIYHLHYLNHLNKCITLDLVI